MRKTNLHKEPDGWPAYIETGKGVVVIDGFFEDEIEAASAALNSGK